MATFKTFSALILCIFLAACGNGNPAGNYSSTSQPIDPVMADTPNNSLDLMIPLDNAVLTTNPQRFSVRGQYISIDSASTGQANLRFNTISDVSRLAYPGSQFSQSFTDLYFDYQAQPGKFLHVIYGDSPDIISSGVKAISDPALPNTIFKFSDNVAGAGKSKEIISAANNINGLKILAGVLSSGARSNAGNSNPGGVVLLAYDTGGGNYGYLETISSPIILAGDILQRNNSINISQFYIPPNSQLVLLYTLVQPNPADFCIIMATLNIQIL